MTQDTHQEANVSGQIDFLDQARLRPQQSTKYQAQIINTLIKATNSGRYQNTIKTISYSLRQLNKNADLKNSEQVKTYIANAKVCNATKTKLAFAYGWFCKTNNIQWAKPTYKWERKLPLISTTARATPRTQENRNNDVLHTTNHIQQQRRIHMQNSH